MSPKPGTGALSARLLLGATLAMGTVLGGASTAFASPGPGAPGDNGTVKIHDPSTPDEEHQNEPKVCDFQIAAFNFDDLQEVSWQIVPKSDKGGWSEEPELEGALTLDDGEGSTEVLDLPDGHYKLYWTFEGKNGAPKKKVFKVGCEDTPKGTSPTPTPTPTSTPTPGETPPPGDEGTESPNPTESPGQTGSPTPDPTGPDEPTTDTGETESPKADDGRTPEDDGESAPSLPVTGTALTALVAAGAVAVAGGGAAVYLTRKRRSAGAQE